MTSLECSIYYGKKKETYYQFSRYIVSVKATQTQAEFLDTAQLSTAAGIEGLVHVLAGRILKSLLHERTQWQEFNSIIAKSSEKQRASSSSQACVHT